VLVLEQMTNFSVILSSWKVAIRSACLGRKINQVQISKGTVERIPESNQTDNSLVHYLSHQAVIRRERSITKLQIVYDGSTKAKSQEVSLNDCLQTGPNFIPKLFDVLIKF